MPSRITVLKVKREHDRQMINEEDWSAELHLETKNWYGCVIVKHGGFFTGSTLAGCQNT